MIASHNRPLIANPTTARTAHTTKRITIAVNMVFTLLVNRLENDGSGDRSHGNAPFVTGRPRPSLVQSVAVDTRDPP
jgi:hypothetical protein